MIIVFTIPIRVRVRVDPKLSHNMNIRAELDKEHDCYSHITLVSNELGLSIYLLDIT